MKMLTLVTILILTACNGADDTPPYEFITDSGVMVRGLPVRGSVPPETIEIWYRNVERCVGVEAPGPLVTVVQSIPSIQSTPDGPREDKVEPIRLGYFNPNNEEIVIDVNYLPDGYVLRHEMVHYLLFKDGYDLERNRLHDWYGFGYCETLS